MNQSVKSAISRDEAIDAIAHVLKVATATIRPPRKHRVRPALGNLRRPSRFYRNPLVVVNDRLKATIRGIKTVDRCFDEAVWSVVSNPVHRTILLYRYRRLLARHGIYLKGTQ